MWIYSKASESKFASYREVCQARDMEIAHCLLEDLKICAEDDVNLLCYMAVDVFQKFPDESRNNSELLHLYVSNIDGTQLYQLVVQCLLGALVLFDKDPSVIELLGKPKTSEYHLDFGNDLIFLNVNVFVINRI